MPDGRVYQTEHGWVAADDAGWTDEVYPTEAAARAAVGLEKGAAVNEMADYLQMAVDEYREELRAKVAALKEQYVPFGSYEEAIDDVLKLIDRSSK